MSKYQSNPPPYTISVPPAPSAPPTYSEAIRGVPPSSPYVPTHNFTKGPEIVTTVVPVGPQSTHMICPHCYAEINTTTHTKPGLIAYIAGTIICLIGCPLGCCLIPCCLDRCMDVHHTCPNCDSFLGRYRR